MSRDRQIAVLASIVGLAALIIGIVAISQDSGADDEWVRNRALTVGSDGGSETPSLQTQLAVQEVADLTNRVEEMERREARATQASTDSEEQSQATQVAVQGVVNDVVDLAERVAELETTSVPDGPEEVAPTEEIPTEEVEYREEIDQTAVPTDESGVAEELTDELLTPPTTTAEPETLGISDQPMALPTYGDQDSGNETPWYISGMGEARPAYILHRELVVPIESTGIVFHEVWTNDTVFCAIFAHCSVPKVISSVEYSITESKHYIDDFISLWLRCPNVINLIPDGWSEGTEAHQEASELYWAQPTVTLSRTANDLPLNYWLAPSRSNNVGNWEFQYEAGSSSERKPWKEGAGYGIVELQWEEALDSIANTELTIIVENTDTSEFHYIDLSVSLSYELVSATPISGDVETGLGPSRCSADLTFVRSYP